ncbi:arsenate reductase (glutaredoxin) [Lutimonas zeaxanthinifaciens]|uniref:arsenate reductase (glutaredoxin) n=1 Tax=Lutimonas zeaxanthinifaciens TaxID=3060215 RepID=UPI00265CA544|nr:arsenate reductase (glutaredoxin) [Lutimonas sp. YSD2104]WKK66900.1 arsenate reductase (glutaredoxin) [Lutimonas sp. YSD2104]
MKIYHNPRCSKSRQGLAIVKEADEDLEIREYLKEPVSVEELTDIIRKLDIPALELVRKNEKDWKENFKNKNLSEQEVIEAMVSFPKLIERPIVVKGERAVIGRPPEKIRDLL